MVVVVVVAAEGHQCLGDSEVPGQQPGPTRLLSPAHVRPHGPGPLRPPSLIAERQDPRDHRIQQQKTDLIRFDRVTISTRSNPGIGWRRPMTRNKDPKSEDERDHLSHRSHHYEVIPTHRDQNLEEESSPDQNVDHRLSTYTGLETRWSVLSGHDPKLINKAILANIQQGDQLALNQPP